MENIIYVLQQDLPDMQAGQEYKKIFEPAGEDYYIAIDKYDINKAAEGKIYTAKTVENNPYFFKKMINYTELYDKSKREGTQYIKNVYPEHEIALAIKLLVDRGYQIKK